MPNQGYLSKAKAEIAAVRGKTLSVEERSKIAIALAALILSEARQDLTVDEILYEEQLGHILDDPKGKALFTALTDQCFRCKDSARAADQLAYAIRKFGIPRYLNWEKKIKLFIFKWLGKAFPDLLISLTKQEIRHEMRKVILPSEPDKLIRHLASRQRLNVRMNLNHLGEAILGEEEAHERLRVYLDDLACPDVEYISIKISTIYSQLNLLARDQTLAILAERFKHLLRAAQSHKYEEKPKFINLDMEEYRDLHLTVDLFQLVLNEPEFRSMSAGIVLQSYLPDSYAIQQKLTEWALERFNQGGAPIKIRLVKGANLAMEKVDAALLNVPQAPYPTKAEVDANFKRMLEYGCELRHARAVRLGIGSHNLFDIAYALLLRSEKQLDDYMEFEMLEGMADPLRRALQTLTGKMLLYCPVANQDEFQYAVAYLVRRLDENTAPDNFLRYAFSMTPGSEAWQKQAHLFSAACQKISSVSSHPRKTQNRFQQPHPLETASFENEADTDWSLPHHGE